jgi:hypothetical protein
MQRAGSDTVLDERSGAMVEAKIVTQRVPDYSISAAEVAAVTELLSKVEALLQRPADVRETVLSVGSLRLDLMTRAVSRNGRTIDLLPREFRLLAYMMRHQGQLVTRAMLFKEVWNYKFVPESNLVDVHIGRLRPCSQARGEQILGHEYCRSSAPHRVDRSYARRPLKLAPDALC